MIAVVGRRACPENRANCLPVLQGITVNRGAMLVMIAMMAMAMIVLRKFQLRPSLVRQQRRARWAQPSKVQRYCKNLLISVDILRFGRNWR